MNLKKVKILPNGAFKRISQTTILWSMAMGVFWASCSSETPILNEITAIHESGWAIEQPIRFEMNVKDTTKFYDVYVTLRHNTDYEYMNLFLFMKTYYPDQEYSRDTLECFLADETGRWFGKGSSIKYREMLYKKQVKFTQTGRYVFEFTQGMRMEKVKNMMDLGLKIVPSE